LISAQAAGGSAMYVRKRANSDPMTPSIRLLGSPTPEETYRSTSSAISLRQMALDRKVREPLQLV